MRTALSVKHQPYSFTVCILRYMMFSEMQGYKIKRTILKIYSNELTLIINILIYKRYSDLQRYKPLLFKRPTQI